MSNQSGQRPRQLPDLLLGLFFLVVALLLAFLVFPAGIEVPQGVDFALSPIMLPAVITAMIGMLGVVLALQTLLTDTSASESPSERLPYGLLRGAAAGVCVGAYYPLPALIGLPATACISSALLLILAGERRLLILLLVGVVLPLVIAWLFENLLYVSFPVPEIFA